MSATHLTPYYEDGLASAALNSPVSEAYTRPEDGLLDDLCEGVVDPYWNQTGMFGALSVGQGPSLFELPDADLDALIHGLCDPYSLSTSVPCHDSLALAAGTASQLHPAYPSPTFAEDRSLWHNALPGSCTYGSPSPSAVDTSQSPLFYYSDETAYSSPCRERSSTMDLFSTLPPDPSPELFLDTPGAGSSSATCHDAHLPTSMIYHTAPDVPADESPKKRANPTSGTSAARRKHTRPSSSVVPYSRTSRVRTTSPRNKQVGFVPSAELVAHEGLSACLYCPFSTQRKGDLKRHVRTHFALSRGQEWVCCGVPEEDALELAGESYEYGGRRMVGGCLKTFSRGDSYLRHLRKARCLRPVDV